MQAQTEKIAGEWESWARRWLAIGQGENAMLWTAGKPATPPQRYLRAYFDILTQSIARTWPEGPRKLDCLELGAGRGTTSQYLAHAGHDVTLIDLAETGFDIARRNWRATGLEPPRCIIADCQATGLAAETFDLVHSVGLVEHFPDPSRVFAESWRLLKKGGLMFHVAIHGGQNGIYRSTFSGADYEAAANRVGAVVTARRLMFRGVTLIEGVKP